MAATDKFWKSGRMETLERNRIIWELADIFRFAHGPGGYSSRKKQRPDLSLLTWFGFFSLLNIHWSLRLCLLIDVQSVTTGALNTLL